MVRCGGRAHRTRCRSPSAWAILVSMVESMTSSPSGDADAAEHGGVDDDVEVHLLGSTAPRSSAASRSFWPVVERGRHPGGCDQPLASRRGDLLVVARGPPASERCRPMSSWPSRSSVTDATLSREQPVEQPARGPRAAPHGPTARRAGPGSPPGCGRSGTGRPRRRRGARPVGLGRLGGHRAPLECVDQVAAARPPLGHRRLDDRRRRRRRPCPRAALRPRPCAPRAGTDGSVSTRRSAGSSSSTPTTENRSRRAGRRPCRRR